jgi:acyl carrier protein
MKENELIKLIKKSLKTKQKIDINSKSNNIEEWDSVGHLILLSNLDKQLKGATSNIADIATADSVKKIINILKKNKLIK